MKAVIVEAYGTPEVIKLSEVSKPLPKANEVLVKVKAASLNALDKHLTRGVVLARPKTGLFKPKFNILGSDLAGVVEAVGEKVVNYEVGDRVFGGRLQGAFAEYSTLEESRMAHIPEGVSFEQAAALPVAAGTALQALRKGEIKAGDTILINGASGGVGTYLIQLAKYFGAYITAVCSGRNTLLVTELGADQVINYQVEPLNNQKGRFDLVIDNVGNLSIGDYKNLMKPKGRTIVIGITKVRGLLATMIRAPFASSKYGKKIILLDTKVSHECLTELGAMLASDHIKSVIEKTYPLHQARDAMEYLWTRRARGKLVLKIG